MKIDVYSLQWTGVWREFYFSFTVSIVKESRQTEKKTFKYYAAKNLCKTNVLHAPAFCNNASPKMMVMA